MSRIPRLRPDDLDESQQRLYAAIVGDRKDGAVAALPLVDDDGHLAGPFNAMLLNPDLGMALQQLGTAVRYRGELSPRSRELAILAVAAAWRCQFELDAHSVIGEGVGLSAAEMAATRDDKPVRLPDDEETAVLVATRTLVRNADLAQDEYDSAAAVLGPAKLFELSTLVGYYSLLALQMRIFDVGR
ncbi:carboxymuconolactone decarboxylase family protein [Mycobacterium sp. CVI_P3]|uniref:Carboxymuconolactone decarboxylase family protein n=1 Tax=Mycobacterium pinniadriaticum TaxID=2994102 RepID=A0ABT3SF99_9MYCO|nr:carboxymuconolactone decarboxylase family protein [Mycobacterium pinniadriaticum]MCX2931736.1 carboxymuconolactone decarboxylase family protein [Mycobacterium pinniadriaticum]MCX2938189.1 carboxymuconolactone decarboxylase family protein [Mycobacterium pinniadriaticum]